MLETLTPREQDVFDLLLKCISPKEITYILEISHHTLDTHRTNIYRKLGVKSKKELFNKYKLKKISSLATKENPIIITPFYNAPYTWHYSITLPMFFNNKIIAGEIYTFSYSFTSNVDFNEFCIGFSDRITNVDGFNHLFQGIALSKIIANTEYSSSAIMIPKKSAKCAEPDANQFVIDITPYTINQPILTFTKFELAKNN
ncbi:MAG: helix-turn-helix transcriptional regulator [Treponema sp.]|nr:helix-turn-helix transcriptional regulator [Treponema sp.]